MDRRQSALIRIAAWSVTAAALIIILILGLTGRFHWFNIGFSSGYYYSDSGKYQAGAGKIDGSQVDDLDVNWMDGSIRIEVYDGDTVQFYEKASRKLEEKEQLHYYNKSGRLMIQYQKAQKGLLSNNSSPNKELTVKIPAETAKRLGYVGVDTISSSTSIKGITADRLELNSTSGDFELENCRTAELDMDSTSGELTGTNVTAEDKLATSTTSGSVQLEGSFRKVTADTVSGDIVIESDICPDKVSTDSVSGEAAFTIPDNDGFTYSTDTVSGGFSCDFEVSHEDERGTYKDGGASFHFSSVSGDFTIKKK